MSIQTFLSNNFQVQFDPNNFTSAQQPLITTLAPTLPQLFEADFAIMSEWFGIPLGKGFGPSNRVIVNLDGQTRGGVNTGYNTHNPSMTINVFQGPPPDSALYNFSAEMMEMFMSSPGKWNWHFNQSDGEGLSRLAAEVLHPSVAPDNVNTWLAFDPTTDPTAAVADSKFRKDWVSVNFTGGPLKMGGTVPGDQDTYSIHCSVLFLTYLRDQLGYTMERICQSGGGTLDVTYKALSHASLDSFPQFRRLLDAHFPGPGHKASSNTPFPLALTDVPGAAAGRHDNLFVISRLIDGRIIFNQAAPGDAFVGWQEVPGGVHTDVALAAGMQKDTLFVFAKQKNGSILFNQAAAGGAFVGWQLGL